ncbi:SusD/RagB family nutrient-binding outer membrane lipoprotein [uncultured Hymenobacter sp.]|uniref:SusD/RagB family nutrient-binding outer membrane lipoprotein n=1 Tax=uncultured Hymenobacter sp. TaxID=170016 RepID=UPI0035CBBC5E
MKVISRVLLAAALSTAATGCESFLDINENPNQATSVTPDALLASALVTTAANYTGGVANGQNYNSYSSFAAGYWGKSGTVSGFAEEQTYNYTSNYYQNLFSSTYDNLNDYNIIQQQGTASGYPNHAAIARIMKVYNFLLLVDQYGDIPYTDALQGLANTSPTYDKADEIYRDFIVQLKGAISDINAAGTDARPVTSEDVVFRGDMKKWKQFANSLQLRILLRESQTNDAGLNTYVATEMTALQTAAVADGFIDADVVAQPGYAANSNQQNPFYNRYGFAPGLVNPTSEYNFIVPTNYIIRQYESNNDPRISQLYRRGTVDSVSAYSGTTLGEPNPPQYDPETPRVGSRLLNPTAARPLGGTFLRSPTQPTVLMLLSEHLFSKAEAETRNLLAGGDAAARTDFNNGIEASFLFTYRTAPFVPTALADVTATTAGVAQYNTYISANATNPLVNFDIAPSSGSLGKQSVIIYQKYLAENTVASTEAWADYRRTAQPKFEVSLRAATPGRLPTRLFYPQTEVSTNAANLPTGVDQFTKIFWDVVD